MNDYVAALEPDVFFTGHDGSLRSEPRARAARPSQYGDPDLFIGSTLQLDAEGNSSTVTRRGGSPGFGWSAPRTWAATRVDAVTQARPGWI